MKTAIAIVILGVIGAGLWGVMKDREVPPEGEQVFCTMEAKLCPDGSYVGRTGPNCEFAACPSSGSGGRGFAPYESGIRGELSVGPTCPNVQIPPKTGCEDKPLSTLVTIFRANDLANAYAVVDSDKNGKFSLDIPPGDYVINAGENVYPRCSQTSVTVTANKYASVKISCDSGIR